MEKNPEQTLQPKSEGATIVLEGFILPSSRVSIGGVILVPLLGVQNGKAPTPHYGKAPTPNLDSKWIGVGAFPSEAL